jgi:hypothetical protein
VRPQLHADALKEAVPDLDRRGVENHLDLAALLRFPQALGVALLDAAEFTLAVRQCDGVAALMREALRAWHNRPGLARRWSMTLGASGSRLDGNVNREFLYLQANYLTRRVSLYAVQEVDYYATARRVDGEQAVSPTREALK